MEFEKLSLLKIKDNIFLATSTLENHSKKQHDQVKAILMNDFANTSGNFAY